MSSNSHSPCAACKFLRRKCTQECVFAPYFPPDQPQKFASVHRVYGASNVAKLLNELSVPLREEAVASLAYEAEARLRDPIYGCVSFISYLHTRLKQIQAETLAARKELAAFIGPQAMMMMVQAYNPYPAPTPAPAIHIPPSLAIQVPVPATSATNPNSNPNFPFGAADATAADPHFLQAQQIQVYNGGGFEQVGSNGGYGGGGGFGNCGGVVDSSGSGYGSNQVVQVVQPEQLVLQHQQHQQRALSDAVVDYQIQAQLSLLNVTPHDHQAHCKSDVGPQTG